MNLKGLHHVLLNEESGGEGTGGGGGGSEAESKGDEGATGAEGGAAGGDGEAAGTGGNVLGQAGKGQEGETGEALAIPEKFQVKKEDGTVDFEASGQKLAQAYSNLEKRLGAGGALPKSAEEYQVAVPDALKEHWKPEEDKLFQDFRARAFENKVPQEAFDFMMGEYFNLAPQLVGGAKQLSADECVAELKKDWSTPEQYKQELNTAYRGLVGYAGEDAEGLMADYGNDPRFIRMMNRMGAEMGEDKSLHNDGTTTSEETVQQLMASKAYTDPKDPQHAAVSAKVKAFFDAQAKKGDAVPL